MIIYDTIIIALHDEIKKSCDIIFHQQKTRIYSWRKETQDQGLPIPFHSLPHELKWRVEQKINTPKRKQKNKPLKSSDEF